jgi:hypothetical protein
VILGGVIRGFCRGAEILIGYLLTGVCRNGIFKTVEIRWKFVYKV